MNLPYPRPIITPESRFCFFFDYCLFSFSPIFLRSLRSLRFLRFLRDLRGTTFVSFVVMNYFSRTTVFPYPPSSGRAKW